MTAPLTPPHQPQPNDPWQAPPSGSHVVPGKDPDAEERRAELRQGALTAAVLTVAGVLLGLLWVWLAPRVPLVSDDTAVFLKNSEGEEAIGADGTFVLLALAFGLVSAAAVFLLRRRGGIPLVVGLALGGLLGSLLAWGLGTWLGPTSDVVAHAKEVGKGVTFDAPLKLHAVGAAVLAWPIAAMIVHLGLTALFGPRDPEPEWAFPYGTQDEGPGSAPGQASGGGGSPAPGHAGGPEAGDGPADGTGQGPSRPSA
ncbi:ABC transporter permease [Streptomyces sp. JH34]|uniref:ABC transporter permease n=1 Tax=Streptomyces sp. JH34 TaxID=2793633 RepID=UPI0023FA0C2C|nr:ABC transporter permease [Streptomyces sp. JH34]MDF6021677.1 ABC transporter permease [Streptomyces sp. JH34]